MMSMQNLCISSKVGRIRSSASQQRYIIYMMIDMYIYEMRTTPSSIDRVSDRMINMITELHLTHTQVHQIFILFMMIIIITCMHSTCITCMHSFIHSFIIHPSIRPSIDSSVSHTLLNSSGMGLPSDLPGMRSRCCFLTMKV